MLELRQQTTGELDDLLPGVLTAPHLLESSGDVSEGLCNLGIPVNKHHGPLPVALRISPQSHDYGPLTIEVA
ncbi:MAG: hypothetical protein ABJA93_06035 [Sporichthyaceae bacterium]